MRRPISGAKTKCAYLFDALHQNATPAKIQPIIRSTPPNGVTAPIHDGAPSASA